MSTRMNVLYLVRTWAIGGSHTIIFLLLRHLPKERFNIVCVPFDTPSRSDDAFVRAWLLYLAFSEAAFAERTLILWSTSRNVLWEKGKTSGETFDLLEARVNCEQNSLLYKVRPARGGICHTRNARGAPRNCFYRRIDPATGPGEAQIEWIRLIGPDGALVHEWRFSRQSNQ